MPFISSIPCFLANAAWSAMNAGRARRFARSLRRVRERQRELLLATVRANAATDFGRRHGFEAIESVEGYRRAVPRSRYEDYEEAIGAIGRGEKNVLTRARVELFEPTSGSSAARKLIPYTRALREEFQAGIAPWIGELFRRRPGLMRGSAYWSISPAMNLDYAYDNEKTSTKKKIPVGFAEDAEYLGFLGRRLFARISAVPRSVARLENADEFRETTLAHLLAARELRFISVWSPTFLTVLIDHLARRDEAVLERLKRISPGEGRRMAELRGALREGLESEAWRRIWPRLELISCWTDGASAGYARELARRFPGVEIQGKGLIATEAFVSLPLAPERDPVLAVDSHFFEFRDPERGEIRLAHELEAGRIYSVIVTTGGGLYRYQLGDLVEVTGRLEDAPTLRFIGREGIASDQAGEKLAGPHVQACAERALAAAGVRASFYLVAPASEAEGRTHAPGYVLFVAADGLTEKKGEVVRAATETGLKDNPHYALCRRLGQLTELKVAVIDRGRRDPGEIYLETMRGRGMRLGDIKPAALDRESGWERRFEGNEGT